MNLGLKQHRSDVSFSVHRICPILGDLDLSHLGNVVIPDFSMVMILFSLCYP